MDFPSDAGIDNLTARRGMDFDFLFWIEDQDGNRMDMRNFTIVMKIFHGSSRASVATIADASVIKYEDRTVRFYVKKAVTGLWPYGTFSYQVEVYDPDNDYEFCPIAGEILINPGSVV